MSVSTGSNHHETGTQILRDPPGELEPSGYVVTGDSGDRIHFLDWGRPLPASAPPTPGILLIHGLSSTAWSWAPVARRLAQTGHTVAMDLRGHGLSDSPTTAYEPEALAGDVVAVAEGAGLLGDETDRIVLAGHGFGAMVAAWGAVELGVRCAGLVLVDGGWEDIAEASGLEPDEFVRTLDEPPEVLRSMTAFLADRTGYDPATWDADQDRAARATVVETAAGRVVPSVRPHALQASVEAMFSYRPLTVLREVSAPIVALVAGEDETARRRATLDQLAAELAPRGRSIRTVDLPAIGHNLMRYRPEGVVAEIVRLAAPAGRGVPSGP
jgi:pimeloyl-ACP methyl ester carboxylesterase